ncbi:hypothetical protein J5X98_21600 [Leptothermofonsia sichuanensis E412]|jgi:hypothetical protein|uniref:hypothetical protein n=1 Tax=Leptothermofonsia sichuanensis TaxID=2917832 RepID=UPI001CA60462|nr:hypothetical protein [Leptothermofonsia sichuanensis]QZZ19876.1 hypothetical protein J5X98_21600 [Leptothermofonsia sichuanensis E412]
MELGEQLSRQRVKHIVSSYQLEGNEAETFNSSLEDLLRAYSAPLIELALVEVLVDSWLQVPMAKGCRFLTKVQEHLKAWEGQEIVSAIAPEQFQQITGLDPTPIFGPTGMPASQPPIRPLM